MAFFITQITGEQLPYDTQLSQILREEGRPEILRDDYLDSPLPITTDGATQANQTQNPSDISSASISHAASSVLENKSKQLNRPEFNEDAATYLSKNSTITPIPRGEATPGDFHPDEKESKEAINSYTRAQQTEVQAPRIIVLLSEIMSSPVQTLDESSSVEDLWRFFNEKRFRHVPIVSREAKLIGIVSDRDFIKLSKRNTPQSVADLITTNIITARPNTDIRSAAKLMFDERIGALPIIDDEQKIVGMVTRSDILRALYTRAPLELWL